MVPAVLAAFAHAAPLELMAPNEDRSSWDPIADLRIDGASPNVVGGKQVKKGRWDDAVGIVFFGAYVGCTGTLIGPKLVLTAGHCVVGYPVTDILVKSKDWADGDGVLVPVEDVVEYPDSQRTRDIALVLLAEEVKGIEPRPIGMECITQKYLDKGAPVQIVGFGATTESGDDFNSALNEARSEVLDPTCKETVINDVVAGCSAAARPAGEVAAGGNGVDACFGDSGGPLYLLTPEGDYVIGATSRAFLGIDFRYPCRDGGIWVRPDAVIDWILEEAGKRSVAMPVCNDAPLVEAEPLTVRGDEVGAVSLTIDDPDGADDDVVFELLEEPEHGEVTIDGDEITYVAEEGYQGEDSFVLTATDGGTDWEYTGSPVTVEVPVEVSVERKGLLGCGCDAGSSGGAAWGVGLALAALARRRR